jgi:hypothetical protein
MNEFPGQLDRRTFIASAGATAFTLALPVLPAEIENFIADTFRASLTELNLKFSGILQESFMLNEPDGFLVQMNGPDYVGHV